jgi:dipeptidase D
VILCGEEADKEIIGKRALECVHEIFDTIREEYEAVDPKIKLSCEVTDGLNCRAFTKEDTNRLIAALINLPCGIQRRNPHIPGMVQTSLNLGIIRTGEKEVKIVFSVRSDSVSERSYLVDRLKAFTGLFGGTVSINGLYPAWIYRPQSRVRDVMVEACLDLYGKEPMVDGTHAGVECALFTSKIPGLDAISLGPDLFDIHTSREKLSIQSVGRTWQLLIASLEKLK